MRRRFALSTLAVLIALVPVRSQDYPARPIRLLVTSPAGSLVDVLSRLLTQDLSTRLGQSIIVDNRPGGMTQVAMDALVRAPADGYTLMLGTNEFVIHCQFGGRPLIAAVPQDVLKYIAKSRDVWFARYDELANWALAADVDEHSYRSRFFTSPGSAQRPSIRARA